MITCKRCGKDNQDHYKFCLGCGAELTAPPAAGGGQDVGMMKTMMADISQAGPLPSPPSGQQSGLPGMSPGPQSPPPGPGPGGPPGPPSNPFGPPPGPPPGGPGGPPPGPPQGFGPPPGAPPLGAPPAGPPPGVPTAATPAPSPGSGGIPSQPAQRGGTQPAAAPRICSQCGGDVPPGYKFCGQCGTPMPEGPPPDFGQQVTAQTSAKGSLTLIRPDGSEGGVHAVQSGENKIGRDHGELFENDGYLSPTHAELVVNASGAVIRDLDSLNGVFVRMTEEERIEPGQIIRLGQELLRFDTIEPPEPLEDGTEVMGSPNPGYWGKITVILGKDVDGSSYPLLGDSVTMGRERGDINFPDDGYVSGLHARLFTRDGDVFVADLGSSNGTFVKVQGERAVGNESFVLLGQQLFRLSLS